jgi:hypothetical protein
MNLDGFTGREDGSRYGQDLQSRRDQEPITYHVWSLETEKLAQLLAYVSGLVNQRFLFVV